MNCRAFTFSLLLYCCLSFFVLGSDANYGRVVTILETEVWDESSQVWKAGGDGDRWSNERGQVSQAPSELKPPEGYEFEGEWKIIMVSAGDSLGWEYHFQYSNPNKRTRVWLRSLRQIPQIQPEQVPVAVAQHPQKDSLSKILARLRDDFNFKGWGFSLYKSLIFPSSVAVAFRLPLTMNFDKWDRHPELPNISTNICLMYPWTIACFLSGSVHLEWVKFVAKRFLQVIPRLLIFLVYEIMLPLLWTGVSAIFSPLGYRLPPLPKVPKVIISKPRYNPELSERIGCSVSWRWSTKRGKEWRISYWHSILPTLAVYRKMMRINTNINEFWEKHFCSIGLSSSYPIPIHPNFSCSGHLCLSGLSLKRQQDERASMKANFENELEPKQMDGTDVQTQGEIRNRGQITPPRLVSSTATTGSLI